MHALIAIYSVTPSRTPEPAELDARLLGMLGAMPGVVAAFWTRDHRSNVAYAFTAFETEEHARELESLLRSSADQLSDAGTRLERAAVAEVDGLTS